MVLLISVYEREEEFQSVFLYLDWWSEQGSMCSLRGKRFRLITSSSLSSLGRRKATNLISLGAQAIHNFDMKQPKYTVFENVNGKATGSDVIPSPQVQPNSLLNEAERAVKRIIKAEVYNQGVKREDVEASGVERSSCDARVWASVPRDKTRWRTL